MATLLRLLVETQSDEAPRLPVLLVAIYDIERAEYAFAETVPSVHALTEAEGKVQQTLETRDAHVVAEAAFDLYLRTLLDTVSITVDQITGRLLLELPNQRPPLRVLHQGFRELRGVVGYLFVVLYEHSRKAVLVRVHDNAECRLYSHIVSLEALFGVDAGDEEEDPWAAEQRTVRTILERLTFDGSQLAVSEDEMITTPVQGPKGMELPTVSASALERFRDSAQWPMALSCNQTRRLQNRVYLARGSLSPSLALLAALLYEPLGSTMHELVIPVEKYLKDLREFEVRTKVPKGRQLALPMLQVLVPDSEAVKKKKKNQAR
jgi:hypothetical protein